MANAAPPLWLLLIEDNPGDVRLLQEALAVSSTAFKLSVATRLSEGVDFLSRHRPDLILLDLNLPDSIGYETFTRLKQQISTIPIILLSSLGNEDLAVRAVAEGAQDYFFKDSLADYSLVARTIRNAKERHETRLQVQRAESRLRAILDSTSDGIVVTDLNAQVQFLNTAAKQMLFNSKLEIGQPFPFLLDPEHEVEVSLPVKDGRTRQLVLSLRTTYSYWDEGPAYCVSFRDVTERKQMVDALLEARQIAEQTANAKSAFLANMSHEIRTPLNGIIGTTSLFVETALTTEQREYVDTIRKSGDYLLALLNDILDISKIDAGKVELEVTEFDLSNLLNDTFDLFSESLREKQLQLIAEVDPEIPHSLTGDPWRFRQILANLISNAVKFTAHGRVRVKAILERREGDTAHLRLDVSDTGVGIEPEAMLKLFLPFSQGDSSTTRKYGGTGLGLAICKRLCELMGGSISVFSQPNEGATFTVRLPFAVRETKMTVNCEEKAKFPRYPTDSSQGKQLPLTPTAAALEPFSSQPLLLVVDDNRVNQKIAVRMLEKMGCRVDVAANGNEAVDAVNRAPYVLILMDCQMPEMDGFEATRRIRQLVKGKKLPIVAMTAHAFEKDRQACLDAGMSDYLQKPITLTDLFTKLSPYLNPLSSTKPSEAHLDESVMKTWKDLSEGANQGFLEEVIGIFLENSESTLKHLEQANSKEDLKQIKRLAHKLRGSSGNFGATALSTLSQNLEEGVESLSKEERLQLQQNLVAEFQNVRGLLAKTLVQPE